MKKFFTFMLMALTIWSVYAQRMDQSDITTAPTDSRLKAQPVTFSVGNVDPALFNTTMCLDVCSAASLRRDYISRMVRRF